MLHRRSLLLSAAAALALSSPPVRAAAPLRADSPATLSRALAGCRGGETVELLGGTWPELSLEGLDFATPVTLAAAAQSPAVLSRLEIRQCRGLTLSGLSLDYRFPEALAGAQRAWADNAVAVRDSARVTFSGCRFTGDSGRGSIRGVDISGAPFGVGPSIRHSDDCAVIGCRITGFRYGVAFNHARRGVLRGNHIEGAGDDTVRLQAVTDFVMEENYLGQNRAHPEDPYHHDHIHHFNPNADFQTARVAIRRNMLFSARDAETDSTGMMLQNFRDDLMGPWWIEENVIIGRARHGISLWPSRDSVIRANTLIRWGGKGRSWRDQEYRATTPMLAMRKGSEDGLIENNISAMERVSSPGGVIRRGDILIPPGRYPSAFVMPDADDPRTWKARPGGPADGQGSPLLW